MPWPGPYTQLRVGDVGVSGVILRLFTAANAILGGQVQAKGDFPTYDTAPLVCGVFNFQGAYGTGQGVAVTFDIIAGPHGPVATNLQQV